MLKTLKRKIALGAVAAVGAAGLVTIAAPAANAAVTSFTVAAQALRAGSGTNSSVVLSITPQGVGDTPTVKARFTSVPTAASADSLTTVAVGGLMSGTLNTPSTTLGSAIAVTMTPANSKQLNTAGAYGVIVWIEVAGGTNDGIDANEPYVNTTINVGGAPASITIDKPAQTLAGTDYATFAVGVKDASGAATKLSSGELVTILSTLATGSAETATIQAQRGAADPTTLLTNLNNGITGAAANPKASSITSDDTFTATTGTYAVKAKLSGASTVTLAFNLGGTLAPLATAVSASLTAGAVAKAATIKISNTAGVTSFATGGAALKYTAPAAIDTGTAATVTYNASPVSAKVVNFALTGTAGSTVNVVVSGSTTAGVTDGTYPVVMDAAGAGTFTATATNPTAGNTYTVTTAMSTGAVATPNAVMSVTYAASAVTAADLGTNGISATPDLSSISASISKTGATNAVTFTVTDQYGIAQQFYQVTAALTAGNRNIAATIAPAYTDASGKATITLADASTSTTALTDNLTFTITAPGSQSNLITGKNTLAISYSSTGTYASLAVTGGTTATAAVARGVRQADNAGAYSVELTPSLLNTLGTAVSGVALTWTGSAGVYFRAESSTAEATAAGKLTTLTLGSTTKVYAYGTKPGTATVTVTGGGLTATATFTVSAIASGSTTARAVSVVAAANKFTATVVDGWGNPVPGYTVKFASTNTGIFGNGVTSTEALTDATGSATALVNSADGKAGAVTVSASITGGQQASLADSPVLGFAAGVASASATGTVPASAAATGDAATAAAQKATDAKIADIATAVTNLSTTVAGLVASLVAQIKDTKAAITDTQAALAALAAVVKKIQVKVKA